MRCTGNSVLLLAEPFRNRTRSTPAASTYFTLIELLVNITCKIYNLSPYAALREREGFGGEKAATCAASLPYQAISTSP